MSDTHADTSLLDQARNIFTLGWDLALLFREQRQQSPSNSADLDRGRAILKELNADLVAMKGVIQSPPPGFRVVAEALRKLGEVVRRIWKYLGSAEGRSWQNHLDSFPELSTAAEQGLAATKELEASRKDDDPLSFLDEPPTESEKTIAFAHENVPPEATDGRPSEKPSSTTRTPKEPKRSHEKGDVFTKLIAALTHHHQYSRGSVLNQQPIANNRLARIAGVSPATASDFFKKKFKSHACYRTVCLDKDSLLASLKLLNQEYAPYHLFGQHPPGESEPDD